MVVHPYYNWGTASMTALVNMLHNDKLPETTTQQSAPQIIDWRNVERYRESWKTWLK